MLSEGRGFAGVTYKVALEWQDNEELPRSVVMKMHATHPEKAQQIFEGYAKEKLFYEEFAHRSPVHTPQLHFAALDRDNSRFVLLLEDLEDVEFGDQIAGGTDDDIKKAVTGLAQHHSAFWNDQSIAELPRPKEFVDPLALRPLLLELIKDVDETFGKGLPHVLAAAKLIVEAMNAPDFKPPAEELKPPFTLVHADYRLDNLGFAADGRLSVIDWGCSPGACHGDLAYFLSCSMTVDQIGRLWDEMVSIYYATLVEQGVEDFNLDKMKARLREALIGQSLIIVLILGLFARQNRDGDMGDISAIPLGMQGLLLNLIFDPRGFELLMAMAERTEAALDVVLPGGDIAGPMLLGALRQVTALKSRWGAFRS
jgi:thiamine kinase-like enzyme